MPETFSRYAPFHLIHCVKKPIADSSSVSILTLFHRRSHPSVSFWNTLGSNNAARCRYSNKLFHIPCGDWSRSMGAQFSTAFHRLIWLSTFRTSILWIFSPSPVHSPMKLSARFIFCADSSVCPNVEALHSEPYICPIVIQCRYFHALSTTFSHAFDSQLKKK